MRASHMIVGAAALAGLLSCQDSTSPDHEVGGLLLSVAPQFQTGPELETGRVLVRGPTDRTVNVEPGSTVTIDELLPGEYTVALEGLVGGEVARFGERSGIQVAAGQNTSASVSFVSFVPPMQQLQASVSELTFTVSFAAVNGAAAYHVEAATNEAFSANLVSVAVEPPATSAEVTVPDYGTYHVRVRARNAYQRMGRASEPQVIDVKRPPMADLVISAPEVFKVSPTLVAAGGIVSLPPWTIRNDGTATSRGISNGFYLSSDPTITAADTRLTNNSNGPMAPGEFFDWGGPTVTIPASTSPGTWYVGILVDYADATEELDEDNNFKSAAITVVAPLLRYAFDGNANNSGALEGYAGTATSVTYPAGKFGQAIKFDGSANTGAILTGTRQVFGTGSKWTISLWFREDVLQTEAMLFDFRNLSADMGWQTYHGVSSTLLTTCAEGGCASLSAPNAGAWHNILFRYDGASATEGAPIQIFIDGALATTVANVAGVPLVSSAVRDMRIGAGYPDFHHSRFYVDELRVYDAVFTPAQQCTLIMEGVWTGTACTLP